MGRFDEGFSPEMGHGGEGKWAFQRRIEGNEGRTGAGGLNPHEGYRKFTFPYLSKFAPIGRAGNRTSVGGRKIFIAPFFGARPLLRGTAPVAVTKQPQQTEKGRFYQSSGRNIAGISQRNQTPGDKPLSQTRSEWELTHPEDWICVFYIYY
jgi:hypothetical protein